MRGMIEVNVKLFAVAKEIAGVDTLSVQLDEGATVVSILDYLVERNPEFARWRDHLRVAVNFEYVPVTSIVHQRDEIAVIPPVSGG